MAIAVRKSRGAAALLARFESLWQGPIPGVFGTRTAVATKAANFGSAATATGLRVLLAGKVTAMASPGGGETQLLATAAALRQRGIDARLWRPWEDELRWANCLHLFGSAPEHLETAAAARRLGLKVVLSTIAWLDMASLWHEPRPVGRRLAACAKHALRRAVPSLPSWRRKLYHAVDVLLPNSQHEAEQLVRLFSVPPERICVVPNGADVRFAAASPEAFAEKVGGPGFVLCPGRIEPRKNQLGLLRALRGTRAKVVVLGDAVPGHEAYLAECRRATGDSAMFLPRIAHDDPLLASAYAACGCLALASWFETPGLVALEAAMSGTPLVLPRGGCAWEYFGPLGQYVSPDDHAGIRRAVQTALAQGRSPVLAALAQQSFSWGAAAEATMRAYGRACDGRMAAQGVEN
ncbi:MAG: glycosyltransferase family 4 protein [Planctomycetia bacterium]|nr:glycosyltransferase family 4 protein [Planctomycetia bacterium]